MVSGEHCIVASEDESMTLYNANTGTYVPAVCVLKFRETKMLYSKKYGVSLCHFAHTANTILHSSTKEDGTLNAIDTSVIIA
jgi:COMPASS component SWD2